VLGAAAATTTATATACALAWTRVPYSTCSPNDSATAAAERAGTPASGSVHIAARRDKTGGEARPRGATTTTITKTGRVRRIRCGRTRCPCRVRGPFSSLPPSSLFVDAPGVQDQQEAASVALQSPRFENGKAAASRACGFTLHPEFGLLDLATTRRQNRTGRCSDWLPSGWSVPVCTCTIILASP
jgi:hypothetical protein